MNLIKNSILLISLSLAFSCTKKIVQNENSSIQVEEVLSDADYMPLALKGKAALQAMKYDSCNYYFEEAFKIKQTSTLSTLRYAACLFSSKNEKAYQYQLSKALDLNWLSTKEVFSTYQEFEYLKSTNFEKRLNTSVSNIIASKNLDSDLIDKLIDVKFEDQRYRRESMVLEQKYGADSPQLDSIWALAKVADSINTEYITNLIDKSGYPGKSKVGDQLSSVAFLVIQHANIDVQEKYLPILTKEADKGELDWSALAILLDRINVRNGMPQKYGSQLLQDTVDNSLYFCEITEPFKIDSIRSSVNLEPIQVYADYFGVVWDPKKHIEKINSIKMRSSKDK